MVAVGVNASTDSTSGRSKASGETAQRVNRVLESIGLLTIAVVAWSTRRLPTVTRDECYRHSARERLFCSLMTCVWRVF
jgi:hypothetical protein